MPDYAPKQNVFQLSMCDDEEKDTQQHMDVYRDFELMVAKDEPTTRPFERKYYVHLIAAVFNHGYICGGATQFKNCLRYINTAIDRDLQAYNSQPGIKRRMIGLFTNLLSNYSNCTDKTFQLKQTHTLEDVQIIRLCAHFVSVVFSLPPNRWSKLFHNPQKMKKEYLAVMPEDSSAAR
eukprot:404901_1